MVPELEKLKKKHIFIGTTEIAGYYRNLAKGLDELGVNYKYVQLSPNTSGFGSQSKLPFFVKLPYLIAQCRIKISVEPGLYTVHKIKKGILSSTRFLFYSIEFLLRFFVVLPWAIINFDIFCFGARSNIVGIKMGYWDIVLLRLLGKRIIYVYHGSDSRPPYINGSIVHSLLVSSPFWDKKLNYLTKKTKRAVAKLDQLADVVIVNPYSAQFHSKPFVNWFSIGLPYCDLAYKGNDTAVIPNSDKSLRVLHAPTHRIAKGSALIEQCIHELQQDGFNIELILVHGRPHADVIEEIKRCDFVIDELYSDALMAGFAAEASYYAKPVIVCGYVKNQALQQHIPTYYCRPDELKSAVLRFINEPQFRSELGKRAQAFIRGEWSYLNIAKCFVKIFSGDIPDDWFISPNKITYLHGFGLTEAALKTTLSAFTERQGVGALQLGDKIILRDAFLSFLRAKDAGTSYERQDEKTRCSN